MKITIHRGTDQIGGCVTEYEHKGFKVFVDYGEQLPGTKYSGPLEIDGLTKGDLSKSILLITHYHGDHIGFVPLIPDEVPIYIGKIGREIQMSLSRHISSFNSAHKNMVSKLDKAIAFSTKEIIHHGDFRITPLTIDHSAFDAYAFKIEADGMSVFHTGDFRAHGFRSRKIRKMSENHVGKVDYVVCEATNVARKDATPLSEYQLQKKFEQLFRKNKGNVVYVSTTNIDRIFSLYRAALNVGSPFFVDRFQKDIMDIVAKGDHIWNKSKLYQYDDFEPIVLKYDRKGEIIVTDKFKKLLDLKGYVLLARSNSFFDSFIKKLPGEKVKYLSMWEGYVKEGSDAFNVALASSLEDGYIPQHTSGHCDMKSLRELFTILQPKGIIPIHTDNPDKFSELFSDTWPIIRLNDGQSFSP